MTMTTAWCPDRRLLLRMGALGLGALSIPGAAQVMLGARGFTHGVASGEPGPTSVLLWTRYVGSGSETALTVELAETTSFSHIISGGQVTAQASRDHIVKHVAQGLEPGRWYYYRFIAPDGATSCIGRTRTLPVGSVSQFNLGVFSCANMGFGWFNAYADAAGRGDIDLAVHVGDYLYEYQAGGYPDAAHTVVGRDFLPTSEAIHLADYRLRYASYRGDAALQRLHQVVPWIAMWDDHELANDAWQGGAQNHTPAREGEWALRKAAALQAYREWMPVADSDYRSYEIGDLATIALPETRITGRMKQFEIGDVTRGQADTAAALAAFRDGPWQAADRSLLGPTQERWLNGLIAGSVAAGKKWQIIAQQVIMGRVNVTPDIGTWVADDAPDYVKRRSATAAAAARAGLPLNMDAWDGYPAARARLLGAAQSAGANIVTLSGDTHNGWAFNLTHDSRPAGVEFAGHSVTSAGFEAYVPRAPSVVETMLRTANPGLRWVDASRRGYMAVALTPARVTSTWRMWDDVRTAQTPMTSEASQSALHGTNRLSG
ncbi:MAG: alkaline phosphatase D family protein [Sphingopyxis sp.]